MASWSRFSFFRPKAEPERVPRVTGKPAEYTDKLTPTVDERTADAAVELLENTAFNRVFDRLRAQYLSDFATSEPGLSSIHKREASHYSLVALDRVKSDIQSLADEKKLHRRRHEED